MPETQLSSKQKAALLVLSLTWKLRQRVMRKLTQQEIEDLTLEITNVRGVPSQVIDNVADEFHQLILAQQYVVQGGLDYAQQLLERTLGFAKAADVLEKVKVLSHVTGFDMLKKADPKQLAGFFQKEHPQTIALILSNLSPEQTAQVLSEFADELRNDVTFRISTLGKVNPALLSEMEEVLEDIAEAEISQSMSSLGGTKSVAAILNRCSTAEAKVILESIEQKNPQLAGEIKRLMFLF